MINNLSELKETSKYLARISAEPRSLFKAVVREIQGDYFIDLAVISFGRDGNVKSPPGYEPTEQEAILIKSEFSSSQFPQQIPCKVLDNLPKSVKEADSKNVFIFRNEKDEIVMLQVRSQTKKGRVYTPWSYFDDGEWRPVEPDGKLPLYNLNKLESNSTVFIHEGAKAARRMQDMLDKKTDSDHPWKDELANAAHLGFIGGALSPHRTDWSVLHKRGVKRVYIVSDNDAPGISAVPKISKHLRCPTFQVQFTSEWPTSFDLADDFPESMFKTVGGVRYYSGPQFHDCLHPVTWATDMITVTGDNGKPKKTPVLRPHFREQWAYPEVADMWVNLEIPSIVRKDEALDKMLAPFSDTRNTTTLMHKTYVGRAPELCYNPGVKGRIVIDKGQTAINLYQPPRIKAIRGDITPFMDFMEYLIPSDEERHEVLRWCATLIAQPQIRMTYALLMVTETQGVGKTTLGANILAPLVGHVNVNTPSESTILNPQFNGWIAKKRLIVVNEIYAGKSWAAYNRLKSYITDEVLEVNEKYEKGYSLDIWAHIYACSNSLDALRIEETDRRWYYPKLNEISWGWEKFGALRDWLDSGGLSIIKYWAENDFTDYVRKGELPKMTKMKREAIEESRSAAENFAIGLAEFMNKSTEPLAIADKELFEWAKARAGDARSFDKLQHIRKAMKEGGIIWGQGRVSVNGQPQKIGLNKVAAAAIDKKRDKVAAAREYLRSPEEIMPEVF